MQLDNEMVSEDEQASLDTLEAEMRKQFGKNYAGTLTLAARPAFLAVADCLLPFSQEEKNKQKFTSKFNTERLIERSGLARFSQKLNHGILAGFPEKIRKANVTKAIAILNKAIAEINKLRLSHIAPLIEQLQTCEEAASAQLAGALNELRIDFEAATETQIEKFTSSVRQKIYSKIELDISNERFENALEEIIEADLSDLNARIVQSADAVFNKFKKSATRSLDDYGRQAKELQGIYGQFEGDRLSTSFRLDIKIDNGINATGLVAALVGGALLFWNPGGWAIVALGVLTTLVGAAKAVWGFISSDYKKKQQRQSADSNISDVANEISISVNAAAQDAIKKIRQQLQETEAAIKAPVNTMRTISHALDASCASLTNLSSSIQSQAIA